MRIGLLLPVVAGVEGAVLAGAADVVFSFLLDPPQPATTSATAATSATAHRAPRMPTTFLKTAPLLLRLTSGRRAALLPQLPPWGPGDPSSCAH